MITNLTERYTHIVTEEDLETFVQRAQAIVDRNHQDGPYADSPHVEAGVLGFHYGRRTWWARVTKRAYESESLYCFVDLRNGNVLYGKGWKGPVTKPSGVRGNIYSEDEKGLGVNGHGAVYLR